MTVLRERRPRLEPRQNRAPLVHLVLPDPLLAHSGARLDPRQITERKDLRGWSTAALCRWFNGAGEDREQRGAVPGRYGVHTAIRPVAHVPGRHRPGLVRDRPFEDEDQLVADVPVEGELGAGLEAGQLGPPLRRLVLPEDLEAEAGLKVLPPKIADGNDLRPWSRSHGAGMLPRKHRA